MALKKDTKTKKTITKKVVAPKAKKITSKPKNDDSCCGGGCGCGCCN